MHGAGSNRSNTWITFAPLLADEGYRVFAPTHGTTPTSPMRSVRSGAWHRRRTAPHSPPTSWIRGRTATNAGHVHILGAARGSPPPDRFVNYRGGATTVDKSVSRGPVRNGPRGTGPDGRPAASHAAAGHVLDALDPGHPRPVPCGPAQPVVGG
ncbi:hypothetical protein EGT67_20010 [Prescottella agglutinans]|uniref:Uncharacterized protein n=1 Tax=Prescottella agglutinans TaxID=1644129 RepID=A0A438B9R0_9NOCA|nr:hypothetical protein [Prescottella agglutinans]RVW07726.1 hypothetical protein EGT67_20010 [Prescottella agglutinans]